MSKRRKQAVKIRTSIAILLSISAFLTHAQFEFTEVNIVCPCTLQSDNNQTAQLQFSIKNNLDVLVDELRATVAIAGEFTDPEHSYKTSAFLDTVAITKTLQPFELAEISTTIDMGVIPNGSFYFELVLHDADEVKRSTTVDSIWFADEITIPSSALDLTNADYLVDSDGDGIDDLNERLENSDPNNPDDRPGPPTIDVLVLYTNLSLNNLNLEASLIVQHHLATSEYMFETSNSPVRFRTVGLLTHDDVSDLADGENQGSLQALPTTAKLALRDEYKADFILVFRGDNAGLCGVAEAIGGWGGRGFIHPHERAEYTEVFLDALNCSTMTTAHEIGHLMGLGHSFNQESLGTFHWSRGHGVEGRFGTIMSYARSAYRASRVDLFSNPDLDCQGSPCGVSHHKSNEDQTANAALSLNITKYQFARHGIPDPEFDVDEDGRGADSDVFPLDPTEWEDTDGDFHGDNSDAFPNDPLEWADTDGDGIGDNSDPDIDNDGRLNHLDSAPFDAETQTVPLLKIVSDRDGDRFGATIARIHDFDSDGLDDLAVAAPRNANAEGVATGTVYLFSFADFTDVPDIEDEPSSSVQLSSLLSNGTTWQIHATLDGEHLGQQLKLMQRNTSSDSSPELLIQGDESTYLLSLDQNDLNALDGEDGNMDRQISLTNCSIGLKCLQLTRDSEFQLYDIADAGDIDNDELTDLAFLGKDSEGNQALLYALTRSGIENALNVEDVDDVTVVDVWEGDDASLLIHTNGIRGNLSIVNVGNVAGGAKPELGIGLPGRRGNPARFYILSTDQFTESALLDSDGDRRIAFNDFIRILSTYRVSNGLDTGFASGVQVVNDVDGDGNLDVLLWDDWSQSFIFSTLTIRVLDIQDSQLDASVTIQEDVQETQGVWAFNNLQISEQGQRSVLLSNDTNVGDGLVAGFRNDFMYASLKDLNYLDDPTGEDLNGSINLPARNRFDNIYRIRLPFGPMGRPVYGGITSLGDLDGDKLLDFTITVHSSEIDRNVSEVYVVFSSALKQLDEADDEVDHFVALHNDFRDTDEDGVPNIFDIDDDGDGLRDRLDVYPLLEEFQYDADFDGVANKLDAFPLLGFAQFDFDGDGINDRWDWDLDGDGIFNDSDEFPRDTDNDGLDNDVDLDDDSDGILDLDDTGPLDTNNDGINNQEDPDDDSDGIPDVDDEFPLDTDNDGENNDIDADDDGDGVMDIDDAFPLDATETLDTDGDGVGDNVDLFVEDATEWSDHDEDGIGDNADLDDDNDGVDDLADAYPLDPEEWADSDGDGYGDNTDQFPHNHLEWVDEDGDGLGDNYGIEGFASYRIDSPWFEDNNRILRSTASATQILQDVNQDGYDELIVTNAFLEGPSHPIFLVSTGDLGSLDVLDGHVNRTLDLIRVQEESNSWQFGNVRRGFIAPKHVIGTGVQLLSESFLDMVIRGPSDFHDTGSVYVVPSAKFLSLDGLDGSEDGVIDYYRCVQNGDCLSIRSSEEEHGLGTSVEILENFFGSSEASLVISTTTGQTRRNDREGVPFTYVLSTSAIKNALNESEDSVLDVTEFTDRANTISIYPEQDVIERSDGRTVLMRLPDLDNDGRDDLVISMPNRDFVYVVMSSDINAADAADDETDRKVDLASIYEQSGSYRFSGFDYQTSQNTGHTAYGKTMPSSHPHYLTLIDGSTSYLVDVASLQELDGEDGEVDGKISQVGPSRDSNVWRLPDIRSAFLCHDEDPTKSPRVVASTIQVPRARSIYGDVRMYSIEATKLSDLDDADGNSDGTINLRDALSEAPENQWQIVFGELAQSLVGLHIGCAGDLDKDGAQDYSITLRQDFLYGVEYRTSIILLMDADLALIDELDGSKDNRLDVSLLWPEDSRQIP